MPKASFQLYSARNFPPLEATLDLLSKAGYAETEGFGGIYGDLDHAGLKALRSALDARGLTMPTGHFGLDMLEDRPQQAIDIAGTLGMDSVFCPWIHPDMRPTTPAGWRDFGARLERAGEPIRAAGFDFGWHNHDFEFVTYEDGTTGHENLFAGGPSLSWEADIAWVVRGKSDPFKWIKAYGDRLTAVHVKDIAVTGQNADEDGWADVGHGTVRWKDLMTALAGTKARHFVIEHDNPNDLKRLIDRSIASFKSF